MEYRDEFEAKISDLFDSVDFISKTDSEKINAIADILLRHANIDELLVFAAAGFLLLSRKIANHATLQLVDRIERNDKLKDVSHHVLDVIFDSLCDLTSRQAKEFVKAKSEIASTKAKKRSDTSKAGKSRKRINSEEAKQKLLDCWKTGKFSTKRICAEEEWEACGLLSFRSALEYLNSLECQ